MAMRLINPDEVPVLDEVDFGKIETGIATMRKAAASIRRRAGEIDRNWRGGILGGYVAPEASELSAKMAPVRKDAETMAEIIEQSADGLKGYIADGKPIKKALVGVRVDAEDLRERVKRLERMGEDWRERPDLVEENERLHGRKNKHVKAHEEAREAAAAAINGAPGGQGIGLGHQVAIGDGLLGGLMGGLVATGTRYMHGRFMPVDRWGNPIPKAPPIVPYLHKSGRMRARPVPWSTMTRNSLLAMRERNWAVREPWQKHALPKSKLMTWGKWAGRSSGVFNAGFGAWEQWEQDSRRRDLTDTQRRLRMGSKAVGAGGGAWLGAQGGAAVGAGIGVWFGGVGAVPGAVIGGVIGGIGGGLTGSWGADQFNENVIAPD